MILPPLAVGFGAQITVGDALTIAFCITVGIYLWQKGKRDDLIRSVERGIESLQEIAEHHEERIRLAENNITQLTAIQESMKDHLGSIDRRHERSDELRRV